MQVFFSENPQMKIKSLKKQKQHIKNRLKENRGLPTLYEITLTVP